MSQGVTILGATGSIGINTLDVITQYPQRFHLVALTGHRNLDRLFQQCVAYQPDYAVMEDPALAVQLQRRLEAVSIKTEILAGREALLHVVGLPQVDIVVSAMVGAAGLLPSVAAVRARKRILLANKEVLVMAGQLFIDEVQRHRVTLLPLDSEHNAILQCLGANFTVGKIGTEVEKVILTASGGPVRQLPLSQLKHVTPEQACRHPTWRMGRKVSVDSATMMNKGFELIEAYWLFGLPTEKIEILLHPQSIIHSLVEYVDGSTLAQLAQPDMRLPIAYALTWPDRLRNSSQCLDYSRSMQLEFLPIDTERYPCLSLAYQAIQRGGTAAAILNAANEVAVQAFLEGRLNFMGIAKINQCVLETVPIREATHLNDILADDTSAREVAKAMIAQGCGSYQEGSGMMRYFIPGLRSDFQA